MPRFLLNGIADNWTIGEEKGFWGFPLYGQRREDVERKLVGAGLSHGCLFAAVVGSFVRFVGQTTSDLFWNDSEIFLPPEEHPNERYPLRISFEVLNRPGTRFTTHVKGLFRDMYAKTVFSDEGAESLPEPDLGVLRSLWSAASPSVSGNLPQGAPRRRWIGEHLDQSTLGSPDQFEARVGDLLRMIGFETELLGHTRPGEQVPDGIGRLHRAHAKWLGDNSYFLLWDAKFHPEPYSCPVGDRDAARRYLADVAAGERGKHGPGKCYFLFVARALGHAAEEALRKTRPDNPNDTICAIEYETLKVALEQVLELGHTPARFVLEVFPQVMERGGVVTPAAIRETLIRLR